jgi:hypothetical protein
VIFNDNGAAGADAEFTYNKTTNQAAIGVVTPAATAALDVTSTTRGFLMPRMTDGQRDAIASPADGLYIFNITTGCPNYYFGGSWYSTCGTIIITQTPPGSQQFNYTGGMQSFTVPAGITSVNVDVLAAGGGASAGDLDPQTNLPGKGGRVTATLTVTPGQILNVYVGGQGATPVTAGYNGGGTGGTNAYWVHNGGGGGGASDIRTTGNTLNDRLVVAGGGGGAGYNCFTGAGSDGGNGGGPNGTDGIECQFTTDFYGGGATQSAGGIGAGGGGYPQPSGTFGVGGSGTNIDWTGNNPISGGAGGGYYGGGAGYYAGGGGGSSYVTPSGSSNIVYTSGVNAGNGSVTISW